MAAMLFPTTLLAAGGLLFALEKSTLPGKVILAALFLASVFSWTVMVTKFRVLRRAKHQRQRFLELFRADRQPLHLYQERARFEGAPVFTI
jgi:biopolymer transport protein ExbB/TolQ